jgi:serine/threonine-protein kinase SRPK3
MASHTSVLSDTVFTLGKLPDRWWNAFKERHVCFEENREPKPQYENNEMNTIWAQLERIGLEDIPPTRDIGPMIEPVGTRLEEEEIMLLSDLLERMLKYRPEERMTIEEVVRHPWFKYTSTK